MQQAESLVARGMLKRATAKTNSNNQSRFVAVKIRFEFAARYSYITLKKLGCIYFPPGFIIIVHNCWHGQYFYDESETILLLHKI